MRTHINGHRILFRVTTREYAEWWRGASEMPPACPFIVVCVDEGAEDRPPALITAYWDGVSDAWEGSEYAEFHALSPSWVAAAELAKAVNAAMKRAGWGGGE